MSANKTQATTGDVLAYLATIEDPAKRADAEAVCAMMERLSGHPPVMWGTDMVGFGRYHYRYDSGREGDWFLTGFAPRKANLSLYIMAGFDRYDGLMARLGKYKTGVSCLYVKRLADVDRAVLEELITASLTHMRATYSCD